MSSSLKLKPRDQCVRLIYGDGEHLNKVDSARCHPSKVFAVIGPFDSHMDKTDLQDMLRTLLRGYNLESK